MKPAAALVGMLSPFDKDGLRALAKAGPTSFALEAARRATRAQRMEAPSSQARVAGYKAAIIAADKVRRLSPMPMTAAGGEASATNT